jgi:hypothetical protein
MEFMDCAQNPMVLGSMSLWVRTCTSWRGCCTRRLGGTLHTYKKDQWLKKWYRMVYLTLWTCSLSIYVSTVQKQLRLQHLNSFYVVFPVPIWYSDRQTIHSLMYKAPASNVTFKWENMLINSTKLSCATRASMRESWCWAETGKYSPLHSDLIWLNISALVLLRQLHRCSNSWHPPQQPAC